MLDRIQPWGVLRVQENVRLETSCRLVDGRVLVNRGVVHEDHDVLVLGLLVNPQLLQGPVQEVVEHHRVGASLSDLGRDHAVLGHSSDHRERVAGQFLGPLLAL